MDDDDSPSSTSVVEEVTVSERNLFESILGGEPIGLPRLDSRLGKEGSLAREDKRGVRLVVATL